jgi:MFS family permease
MPGGEMPGGGTPVGRLAGGEPPADPADRAGVRPFLAWYALILLTVIYGLSFLDRGLLALVIGLIKADLHASDLQLSLLFGLSFVLLYCLFSIPAGHFVDRHNRSRIIAGAIALWSLMELLCGLAGSYGQLFVFRAGLGIGEAAVSPAAYSLIRDMFPAHRRGLPYALFGLGASVGTALALVVSGSMLRLASGGAFAGLPFVGTLHPWQIVLIAPALAGVPLALLMLTVPDGKRRPPPSADAAGFAGACRHIGRHWTLYLPLWLGFAFCAMPSFNNGWVPEAVVRNWGASRPVVGHVLGLLQLGCSVAGSLGGGLALNAVGRRGVAATMWVAVASVSLAFVLLAVVARTDSLQTAAWLWGLALIFTPICNPACSTVQAQITPAPLMGRVIALYYTVGNLIAVGIGPTLVAFVARCFAGPRALADALVVTNMGCLTLGVGLMASVAIQFGVRARSEARTEARYPPRGPILAEEAFTTVNGLKPITAFDRVKSITTINRVK